MPLGEHVTTDVAIVGGGIAGVVTAYYTLRDTDKKVVLIEADKVAHGSTGHNAGQITSYFERPLSELVDEFGLDLAIDGQRSIESGWELLENMYSETGLQTPLYRFTGYAGCSTLAQLLVHLKNNSCRVRGGLQTESILVAEESPISKEILKEFEDLYSLIPHKDLLALLETNNPDYVASLSYPKGCMNSALFSEELIGYLIATYKDRFSFYEGSPVRTVTLKKNHGTLRVLDQTVEAERVVLCTNGFENFSIVNESGPEIDTNFHHLVSGRIGYMTGYFEPMSNPPTAISYLAKESGNGDPTGESYFYLTRRPHEHESKEVYNLVCTGGPEKVLPNQAAYSRDESCSESEQEVIDEFLWKNYRNYPKGDLEYAFCWHGLMAYTPNGVRRIGPEPRNPTLLYNLGCNGVGILPSIFGGKKIPQFLLGAPMEPSIFDPRRD